MGVPQIQQAMQGGGGAGVPPDVAQQIAPAEQDAAKLVSAAAKGKKGK
jgi:hypothetical protein